MDESASGGVGGLIRSARTARGMSQIELAEAVGLRQQTVSKWESGASTPSRPTMLRLSQVLKIELGDLLAAAGWTDVDEDVRRRLREFVESNEIERAGHGGSLAELREVDPERYTELEELAAFYLERARQRSEAP